MDFAGSNLPENLYIYTATRNPFSSTDFPGNIIINSNLRQINFTFFCPHQFSGRGRSGKNTLSLCSTPHEAQHRTVAEQTVGLCHERAPHK